MYFTYNRMWNPLLRTTGVDHRNIQNDGMRGGRTVERFTIRPPRRHSLIIGGTPVIAKSFFRRKREGAEVWKLRTKKSGNFYRKPTTTGSTTAWVF